MTESLLAECDTEMDKQFVMKCINFANGGAEPKKEDDRATRRKRRDQVDAHNPAVKQPHSQARADAGDVHLDELQYQSQRAGEGVHHQSQSQSQDLQSQSQSRSPF